MATVSWRKNKVFLNGIDYFGSAEEGSVEIKRKLIEVDAMGLPAAAKIPSGKFEPIVAKLKLSNISPLNLRTLLLNDGYIDLRMTGECRLLNAASGTVTEDMLITVIRGYVEEIPLPAHKSSDKSEAEISIHCLFLEVLDRMGTLLKVNIPDGIIEPKELS